MSPTEFTHDGFAQSLRAEWAAFRGSRARVIGVVVAAVVTVLPGLLIAAGSSCSGPNGNVCPAVPLGPSGEVVTDKFYFVHQALTGDGSITARITALTGLITYPPPKHDQIVPGVVPWAKAGVLIKESTTQGSAYAAVMITGGHGVRMQYDFTEDVPGRPGGVSPESPRWLRLVRSGSRLSGYESVDGKEWTRIGEVQLKGLSGTLQAGLFVTSPCDLTVSESACRFTNATAAFDNVSLEGAAPGATWSRDDLGAERGLPAYLYGSMKNSAGTFTVTGSGDIAARGEDGGWPIERTVIGTVLGLLALVIVAGPFGAAPLAGRRPAATRAARAAVMGAVAFATGLATTVVAIPLVGRVLLSHGNVLLPTAPLVELRVVFGTAALFALAAIFAASLGGVLRHGGAAVAAGVAAVVLPYLLAVVNALPVVASEWLLRLTPAAGFAIQQTARVHPQVIALYTPQAGYFPLAPWAGLAVLAGYAALALGLAVVQAPHRDRDEE